MPPNPGRECEKATPKAAFHTYPPLSQRGKFIRLKSLHIEGDSGRKCCKFTVKIHRGYPEISVPTNWYLSNQKRNMDGSIHDGEGAKSAVILPVNFKLDM
jgi:hypothetical protein